MNGNEETLAISIITKGVKKVSKDFKRMQKDLITLDQLGGRIKSSLGGTFNDIAKKTKLPKDAFVGNKKGFSKEQFLSIEEFGKQYEMFGKKVKDTTKQISKSKPLSEISNSREIKDLERNFNKVQTAWKKEEAAVKKAQNLANKEIEKATKIRGRASARQEKYARSSITSIDKFTEKIASQKKIMKQAQVPFAGYAMSIMFFGMALKRMFDTIWKSSTKVFQDVKHSVEGTTTGFDMLQGSMKYLGFVIGEALEPVTAWLIPIIDSVSDWVELNPKLTEFATIALGIVGTLALVGGSGKLAYDGLKGLAKVLPAGSMGGISKLFGFLATPVGAGIVAALALLGTIAWKSFKETPEAWKAMKDAFKNIKFDSIKTALADIWTAITGLPGDSETMAWTMAWGAQIIIDAFKAVINIFSLVVESLAFIIDMAKLGWLQLSKIWSSEEEQEAIDKKIKKLKDGMDELVVHSMATAKEMAKNISAVGGTVALGVSGYKEQELAKQALEKLSNTHIIDNKTAPYSNEYINQQPTIGESIQPIQLIINGDNVADFFNGKLLDAIKTQGLD